MSPVPSHTRGTSTPVAYQGGGRGSHLPQAEGAAHQLHRLNLLEHGDKTKALTWFYYCFKIRSRVDSACGPCLANSSHCHFIHPLLRPSLRCPVLGRRRQGGLCWASTCGRCYKWAWTSGSLSLLTRPASSKNLMILSSSVEPA